MNLGGVEDQVRGVETLEAAQRAEAPRTMHRRPPTPQSPPALPSPSLVTAALSTLPIGVLGRCLEPRPLPGRRGPP